MILKFFRAIKCEEHLYFPNDFIIGAATASYQVEGAWNTSGKDKSLLCNKHIIVIFLNVDIFFFVPKFSLNKFSLLIQYLSKRIVGTYSGILFCNIV